jgi:hypothetical protein
MFGGLVLGMALTGIFLGSAVVTALKHYYTKVQMVEWGWRVPFAIGIVVCLVGFLVRTSKTARDARSTLHAARAGHGPQQSSVRHIMHVFTHHGHEVCVCVCVCVCMCGPCGRARTGPPPPPPHTHERPRVGADAAPRPLTPHPPPATTNPGLPGHGLRRAVPHGLLHLLRVAGDLPRLPRAGEGQQGPTCLLAPTPPPSRAASSSLTSTDHDHHHHHH